ncbi:MAG: radical SAM protein [Candidatus Magasanikbacteria bacterium]|nr:radical SAM protein [Candidatus Magasanikbacteria bacterium]
MNNKIKKTVIFTSYECNNHCIFCIDEDKKKIPGRSTDEILTEIKSARERGSQYLELIGGEVTIRQDAIDLISYARDLGFKTISLTTNGRMLSYPEYAEKIIKAGLTDVVFSIHGHNEELHDSLTRVPGSFCQLSEGIKNLQKLNFDRIGSNTTIVKQNYESLEAIAEFILSQGIRNAEFIFVDCNEGAAKSNFEELVPRISDCLPEVKKCLELGRKAEAPHWHVRYLPLCGLEEYLDQISEIDEVKKFQTEHSAPDFFNPNAEQGRAEVGRAKAEACKNCRLDGVCEGAWKEYLKKYGSEELSSC